MNKGVARVPVLTGLSFKDVSEARSLELFLQVYDDLF
jgi:hypothetical protein